MARPIDTRADFKAWIRKFALPVIFLLIWGGPVVYTLWRDRQPAPIRYLGPGIVLNGQTVSPTGGSSAASLAQGDILELRWTICNDTTLPLHITIDRQFRSTSGHTAPVETGSIDIQPGCNELPIKLVGVTSELLIGYSWWMQGSSRVTQNGREWVVPWRTTSFVVRPRRTDANAGANGAP